MQQYEVNSAPKSNSYRIQKFRKKNTYHPTKLYTSILRGNEQGRYIPVDCCTQGSCSGSSVPAIALVVCGVLHLWQLVNTLNSLLFPRGKTRRHQLLLDLGFSEQSLYKSKVQYLKKVNIFGFNLFSYDTSFLLGNCLFQML